jgi:hypothetical protein
MKDRFARPQSMADGVSHLFSIHRDYSVLTSLYATIQLKRVMHITNPAGLGAVDDAELRSEIRAGGRQRAVAIDDHLPREENGNVYLCAEDQLIGMDGHRHRRDDACRARARGEGGRPE